MSTYLLHLETATKVCSVALSKDGKCVALKESHSDQYAHGENLNLFIIDVCQQAGVSLKKLKAISVVSGPGSYTGLRIGAATAKSLCYTLEIPLISVDTLTSLAQGGMKKYQNINYCPVIDARRMEVYNAIFDENGKCIKPISADVIDEDSYNEYLPFVCFGDGAEKLKDIWKDKQNCIIDTSILCSAEHQISPAYDKYLNHEFEDVAYWEPFYLKDFIAGKKKT